MSRTLIPVNMFFCSSRFREIGRDIYGHFDSLVAGTFHVSTCEIVKKLILVAKLGALNSICNGEAPQI